jgi:cytochrome c oxidase assembly protein Cox11
MLFSYDKFSAHHNRSSIWCPSRNEIISKCPLIQIAFSNNMDLLKNLRAFAPLRETFSVPVYPGQGNHVFFHSRNTAKDRYPGRASQDVPDVWTLSGTPQEG